MSEARQVPDLNERATAEEAHSRRSHELVRLLPPAFAQACPPVTAPGAVQQHYVFPDAMTAGPCPSFAALDGQLAAGSCEQAGGGGMVAVFDAQAASGLISPVTTIMGSAAEGFGFDMDTGDLDGDGHADLIVGAAQHASGRGAVYVFYGPLPPGALTSADWDARYTPCDSTSQEAVGWSVSFVEDSDGDGLAELLVGAPAWAGATGRVYHWNDPGPGDWCVEDALLGIWTGKAPGDYFGFDTDAVGDTDGAGGPVELAIGAPGANGGAGEVVLLDPLAGTLLVGLVGDAASGDHFGYSVAGLGSFEGSSGDDLAVGSPGHDHAPGSSSAGALYAYAGRSWSSVQAHHEVAGFGGDRVGWDVAGLQPMSPEPGALVWSAPYDALGKVQCPGCSARRLGLLWLWRDHAKPFGLPRLGPVAGQSGLRPRSPTSVEPTSLYRRRRTPLSDVEVQTMSNKKQKKAIRARKKRTGESYSTARMNHLAKLGAAGVGWDDPGDVTVITTCEKAIALGTTTRRLRLAVGLDSVHVALDDLDLGKFPAPLVGGKAHVPDGEYALSDGWAVRVEGEYEEPMPEFGIEGGWRTGGHVALLPPPEPNHVAFVSRPALVWVDFRTDGSLCGSGGTWTPLYRAVFAASGVPPVQVEVETLPSEGDESQNVLDYHRRKVVRVVNTPPTNGTDVRVELGEPLVPEGAWSLASPNFPAR